METLLKIVSSMTKKYINNQLVIYFIMIILAYGASGFWLLPTLAHHFLPPKLSSLLDRDVVIGDINFNPYTLSIEIQNIAIKEKDGGPLISVGRIDANLEMMTSIFNRAFTLSDLRIETPRVDIVLDEKGGLNLSKMGETTADDGSHARNDKSQPPPPIFLEHFLIKDGALNYRDLAIQPITEEYFNNLELEVLNVGNLPGKEGEYQIDASIPEGGHIAWSGALSLNPLYSKGQINLHGLRLPTLLGLVRNKLSVPMAEGVLGLSSKYELNLSPEGTNLKLPNTKLSLEHFKFTSDPISGHIDTLDLSFGSSLTLGKDKPKILLEDLDLQLGHSGISLSSDQPPVLAIDHLSLTGGQIDKDNSSISFNDLDIQGGQANLVRAPNGDLEIQRLGSNKGSYQPNNPQNIKATTPSEPDRNHWHFSLSQLGIHGFGVNIVDQTMAPNLTYNLDDISITVKDLSNVSSTPVSLDASLKVRQGGSLKLQANGALSGEKADAKIVLEHFNLNGLQPLISPVLALKLDSADLSTNLDLNYHKSGSTPSLHAIGTASIDNLKLSQTKDGKRFLAWRSLSAKGIDFNYMPLKLSIKDIKIIEPDTSIAISADKSTNLGAIVQSKTTPTQPSLIKTEKNSPTKPKKTALPPNISIERISVASAQLDYSDLSLLLPFSTHINKLGGSVTGFSLAKGAKANLRFNGQIDQYGESLIEGALMPEAIKDFLDINVVFRNIEMNSLSPYSATFAGRKIQSGKLSLDLAYRIKDHQLQSTNKIYLEKLTLGESIESPGSSSLPLDLAVALLTDSDGKITVTVPLEGDVDSPSFNLGSIVWDAFKQVILNAVKAPFKTLGHLFQSDESEFNSISFEPGGDIIIPSEKEKLSKLSSSLLSRTQIKIIIHGLINSEADTAALQGLEVRSQVAKIMGIALGPKEYPDKVNFSDASNQRALEKIADLQAIGSSVESLYEKNTGKRPKRVGVIAGFLGASSETPDFYELLYTKLVKNIDINSTQLELLAEKRAGAVAKELSEQFSFPKSRVVVAASEKVETQPSDEQSEGARLELGTTNK